MSKKDGTKLCKHCKTEIPAGAKVCPNCRKKQGGILKFVIIGVIVIAIIGSFGGSDSSSQKESSSVSSEKESTPNSEKKSDKKEKEVATASTLNFDIMFSSAFRNDTTGRWRKSLVSTNKEIQEYALDYYKQYFKSDDEVHVIYNFSLNTVNCLTVNGDTLFISITDYVDGEEHDAKSACGGTHLGDFQISIDSGEIIYNSFDE